MLFHERARRLFRGRGVALTPIGMLMQLCNQLMLPGLAKVASDASRLHQDIKLHTAFTGACAAGMGVFFIFFWVHCPLTSLRPKILAASEFIGWLGVRQAIRLFTVRTNNSFVSGRRFPNAPFIRTLYDNLPWDGYHRRSLVH